MVENEGGGCGDVGSAAGGGGGGGEVVGCEMFAVNQICGVWEGRFGSLGLDLWVKRSGSRTGCTGT